MVGLPVERVVIPSGIPVVPRIVVGIGLELTGVEHAVMVDVSVVVMVALSEGAACKGDLAISVSAILFFIVLFVASRDFSSVKSHFRGLLIVGIMDTGWVAHSLRDQTPASRKT